VRFNPVWPILLRKDQNGFRSDQLLDPKKCGLSGVVPLPFLCASEVKERPGDMRVVLDEAAVEVDEPEEGLEFSPSPRGRPVRDSGDLYGVHLDLTLRDDDSEILHLGSLEIALVCSEEELVLLEDLQDTPEEPAMLFARLGVDQNVIQIDNDHTFHNELPEEVVHHGLEGRRAVGQSEEHYQQLEESARSPKHGLPLVTLLDLDVVETPLDVELGEVASVPEFIHQVRDERERVPILDRHAVELPVVLDQAERSILLLDKEHRGSHGRLAGADPASPEVFFQEFIQLLLLRRGQRVALGRGRFHSVH
ncbi:hypothetical protein PLEOSDRAFT_1045877, partial [Pleurotus ostreatus PC15]